MSGHHQFLNTGQWAVMDRGFDSKELNELRKFAAEILAKSQAGEELTMEMFNELAQIHLFKIACENVKHNDKRLQEDGLKLPELSPDQYELSVRRRALERLPRMFS